MKVEIYHSESDVYEDMELIGRYRYLGGMDTINLTDGYIYDRVGSEEEFRIVDDFGEGSLYLDVYFEKVADQFIPCPNCNGNLVDILYGMPSS